MLKATTTSLLLASICTRNWEWNLDRVTLKLTQRMLYKNCAGYTWCCKWNRVGQVCSHQHWSIWIILLLVYIITRSPMYSLEWHELCISFKFKHRKKHHAGWSLSWWKSWPNKFPTFKFYIWLKIIILNMYHHFHIICITGNINHKKNKLYTTS